MKQSYVIAGIIIVVIIVLGFLFKHQIKLLLTGSSTPEPTAAVTQEPSPTASESAQMTASPSASTASESANASAIVVKGSEFMFMPNELTATAGKPITITFENTGKYPHNFTISSLNVATKTIKPGESDSVTFTPAKAGSYKITCSVDSHAEKGMTGTLTVK